LTRLAKYLFLHFSSDDTSDKLKEYDDEDCNASGTLSPIDIMEPQSPDEQLRFDYPSYPLEQSDREPSPDALDPREKEKSVSPPRHCICGSSSPGLSSMIECHSCHGFFHGNCVGISRQKALLLKHFYCMVCMDKNPELVTEFETKGTVERGSGEGEESKPTMRDVDEEGGVSQRVGRKRVYKGRKGNRT